MQHAPESLPETPYPAQPQNLAVAQSPGHTIGGDLSAKQLTLGPVEASKSPRRSPSYVTF